MLRLLSGIAAATGLALAASLPTQGQDRRGGTEYLVGATANLLQGGTDQRGRHAFRVPRRRRRRRRAKVRRWRLSYTAMARTEVPSLIAPHDWHAAERPAAPPAGLHSGAVSGTPPP